MTQQQLADGMMKGAKALLHRLSSDMEGRKFVKARKLFRGPKSFSPKRFEVASFYVSLVATHVSLRLSKVPFNSF